MTEARLRRLARLWAGRLGLSHLEIELVVEALDDDTKANADLSPNYDFARITFQPWMIGRGDPPERTLPGELADAGVEKTLVHELLHVALKPIRRVRAGFEEQVHPDAWSLFENLVDGAEETVVDRVAVALTRSWPSS